MSKKLYEKFSGDEITDSMLQEAAKLFSENYGIWSKEAASVIGPFVKEGARVRISKNRLRNDHLPQNAACTYVRVTIEEQLAGNALACRWKYNNRVVCWVTQLVVHRDYRERGLATGMLNELREDDEICGLVSSHAASCLAAAKVFGSTINLVQLDFIREHAQAIMEASPIKYIQDAKLRGSLFDPDDTSGVVSSVNTDFYVDHTEPLEALKTVREEMDWPLGELLDGHEFLVVLKVRRRRRSKARYMSSSSSSSSSSS